jgi:hypothetical protein
MSGLLYGSNGFWHSHNLYRLMIVISKNDFTAKQFIFPSRRFVMVSVFVDFRGWLMSKSVA